MRAWQLERSGKLRELHGGRPSARDEQELRTEFDRDYDRAVFSTPVRRLQDKTQVFPLEPHDAVRTRLTHSLEVSTLARGLARAVAQKLAATQRISQEQALGIEVIAATCGLIHDVGNPPFGHAGEKAISSWFKQRAKLEPGLFQELDNHPLKEQLQRDFLKCKAVGRKHVYSSTQTLRLELLGRRVIHDLMDIFWEGVSAYDGATQKPGFPDKIYNLLSRNYRAVFEQAFKNSELPKSYHRFQLVTDYVCGMTDTFACKLHSELTHG